MKVIYKKQLINAAIAVALFAVLPWSSAGAAQENANSAAISQGFQLRGDAVPGTLVSFIDDKDGGVVGLANVNNVEKLVGVVGEEQLVELSGKEGLTQVVTNGSTLALVSDINGPAKLGDKITASPLSGIGMKAVEAARVIGTAQHDFSEALQVTERQITDINGRDQTVRIGLVRVQVAASYYQPPENEKAFLPPVFQRFANVVTGRSIEPLRVLIAFAMLLAGFVGVGILLYSSVRSSIISIGRNPLSAKAVHRSLLEVGLTTFGVLLLTVIAVYLVLVI